MGRHVPLKVPPRNFPPDSSTPMDHHTTYFLLHMQQKVGATLDSGRKDNRARKAGKKSEAGFGRAGGGEACLVGQVTLNTSRAGISRRHKTKPRMSRVTKEVLKILHSWIDIPAASGK